MDLLNFVVNQDVKTVGGKIGEDVSSAMRDGNVPRIQCGAHGGNSKITLRPGLFHFLFRYLASVDLRFRAIISTELAYTGIVLRSIGSTTLRDIQPETFNHLRERKTQ